MKLDKNIFIKLAGYLIGVTLLAYSILGHLLFQLDATQLDRSGDGFKNYFAFAYQYNYGHGLWFEGMQYPYGDLLAYADGQPAFLALFKMLKFLGIDISGYELFVVQSLPVAGILLSAFILDRIAKHYQFPFAWRLLSVLACLALSPQVYRFNSHYGLAYMFCFPSIWLLIMNYRERILSQSKFIIFTSVLLLFFAFIHPYHLLIGVIFLLAFGLVTWIKNKRINGVIFISGLIPLVSFLLINKLTDPYNDRPGNPWGAWHYKTELADFLPFTGPIHELLNPHISLRPDYFEGYCYPGFLFFLAPVLICLFIYRKKAFGESLRLEGLYAALLVLLFAMGFHMWITDKQINEWIPQLKQFRALGRFSWPFYYIAFFTLIKMLYELINNNRAVANVALAIISLLWIGEAFLYHNFFQKKLNTYKAPNELYQNQNLLAALNKSTYKDSSFQAILTLPLSIEGAEKIITHDNWFAKTEAFPLSFQTGIPMFGAYMSRTSLSRILKQLQLTSSPFIKKEIADDLNNEDILLVCHKSDTLIFSDIIQRAYRVGESKENILLGINKDSLTQVSKPQRPDSLESHSVVYKGFENLDNPGLLSRGSQKINDQNLTLLDTLIPNSFKEIKLSLWQRIDPVDGTTSFFEVKFYQGDQLLETINYRDKDIKRMEVIENWVQLKKTFNVPENANRLVWNIKSEDLFIDHVLATMGDHRVTIPLDNDRLIYDHFIVYDK